MTAFVSSQLKLPTLNGSLRRYGECLLGSIMKRSQLWQARGLWTPPSPLNGHNGHEQVLTTVRYTRQVRWLALASRNP